MFIHNYFSYCLFTQEDIKLRRIKNYEEVKCREIVEVKESKSNRTLKRFFLLVLEKWLCDKLHNVFFHVSGHHETPVKTKSGSLSFAN